MHWILPAAVLLAAIAGGGLILWSRAANHRRGTKRSRKPRRPMTITSTAGKAGPFTGNGSTTHFDFAFPIPDASYVRVVRTQGGADTTLVLDTNYTVTGLGNPEGGQVILNVALAVGQTLNLYLDPPFTQEIDLESQEPFDADTVERALDLAAQRDIKLRTDIEALQSFDIAGALAEAETAAATATAGAVTATTEAGIATTAAGGAAAAVAATLAADVTASQAARTGAESAEAVAITAATNAMSVALGAWQDFNLLDNADFVIDQRDSAALGTYAANQFMRDRWHSRQAGTTFSVSSGLISASGKFGQVKFVDDNELTYAAAPMVVAVRDFSAGTLTVSVGDVAHGMSTPVSFTQNAGGWAFADVVVPGTTSGNLVIEFVASSAQFREVRMWPGTTHPSAISRISKAVEWGKALRHLRVIRYPDPGFFLNATTFYFPLVFRPFMRANISPTVGPYKTTVPAVMDLLASSGAGVSRAASSPTNTQAPSIDWTGGGISVSGFTGGTVGGPGYYNGPTPVYTWISFDGTS